MVRMLAQFMATAMRESSYVVGKTTRLMIGNAFPIFKHPSFRVSTFPQASIFTGNAASGQLLIAASVLFLQLRLWQICPATRPLRRGTKGCA